MTRPLRVAIVGAGLMGRWHAHAAARVGAVVAAIVDPDLTRASALAGRHRGSRACGALADVLDEVDLVHVCSPPPTHAPVAMEAAGAGRHVLVEKPIGATAAETAAVLSAAEARGVLACPVHQFPFQPGVQRAIARIADLGAVRHVDVTICSAGANGLDDAARDAIALDILFHPLSLLARVLVHPVDALAWSAWHSAPGEIRAVAHDGAATAAVLISMSGRPTTNHLRVIGSRGTADADLFHGFSVIESGRVSRWRKATRPYAQAGGVVGAATWNLLGRAWRAEHAYPGLRTLVARFHHAAATGGVCPIPAAETLALSRAADQIRGGLRHRDRVDRPNA